MATLTVQTTDENGGMTYAAATSGGDAFANDGQTLLAVINGGGSSVTVTVTAQTTASRVKHLGEVTKADGGGAVAAGATQIFGPFPQRAFNDASSLVQITYSGVTTVTVAAFKMPAT